MTNIIKYEITTIPTCNPRQTPSEEVRNNLTQKPGAQGEPTRNPKKENPS
ncbi:hypothetical protein [uncultured Ruegeria sp.]|nr:hypothetical protein [uncultured Ruegeria sp.]